MRAPYGGRYNKWQEAMLRLCKRRKESHFQHISLARTDPTDGRQQVPSVEAGCFLKFHIFPEGVKLNYAAILIWDYSIGAAWAASVGISDFTIWQSILWCVSAGRATKKRENRAMFTFLIRSTYRRLARVSPAGVASTGDSSRRRRRLPGASKGLSRNRRMPSVRFGGFYLEMRNCCEKMIVMESNVRMMARLNFLLWIGVPLELHQMIDTFRAISSEE